MHSRPLTGPTPARRTPPTGGAGCMPTGRRACLHSWNLLWLYVQEQGSTIGESVHAPFRGRLEPLCLLQLDAASTCQCPLGSCVMRSLPSPTTDQPVPCVLVSSEFKPPNTATFTALPASKTALVQDLSCEMIFGQAPPPLEEDPVYKQPCFVPQCSLAQKLEACPKTDTERNA